jgi:dTDP-4-dehydrorhamnose 3,5-epimerase
MIFTETKLKGAFLIDVEYHEDERGFFGRVWSKKELEEHGLNPTLTQASVSYTKQARTIRGLHYQAEPFAECKTIRCTAGAIFDVIIDVRPDSATFKQWVGNELTGTNLRTIYVPTGFAHGFMSLEDHTYVHYLSSQDFSPGAEKGIVFNDPMFSIDWPFQPSVISSKDRMRPFFIEN